uniref:ATP-dependent DNA helicase n=1 Tax=Globodera pallida TaxID=36090 RepID=A0A183C9T9_GLOPA
MKLSQKNWASVFQQLAIGNVNLAKPNSEELEDFVYPDLLQLLGNDKEMLRKLILATHSEREYLSSDKPLDERPLEIDKIESEVAALNSRIDSEMTPHYLRLKVGCAVVLPINKSDREGLTNGTRVVIEQLGDDKLSAGLSTALLSMVKFGSSLNEHAKFMKKRSEAKCTSAEAKTP